MRMNVKITQNAVQYFGTLNVPRSECQEHLDKAWQKDKLMLVGGNFTKRLGRALSANKHPEDDLSITKNHYNYWLYLFMQAVGEYSKQKVVFVDDLQVHKVADCYNIDGIFYLMPQLRVQLSEVLSHLQELFLRTDRVRQEHVDERLEMCRTALQVKTAVEYEDDEPLKMGDKVLAFMSSDYHSDVHRLPEPKLLHLGTDLPDYLLQALLGQHVPGVIIVPTQIEQPSMTQKVVQRIELRKKMRLPEVTDEQLCQHEGVADRAALLEKCRQFLEEHLTTGFQQTFNQYLMQVPTTPIPACSVHDRAEGWLNALIKDSTEAEVMKSLSVSSIEAALQALLPRAKALLQCEVVSYWLCRGLDISPDESSLLHFMQNEKIPDHPYSRLVGEMALCYNRAKNHYQSAGRDKGEPSRIIVPDHPQVQHSGLIVPGIT